MIDLPFRGRRLARQAATFWRRAAREAEAAPLAALERQRTEADALATSLAEFRHVADERLAFPRPGANRFPQPGGTDWAWRPDAFRGPLSWRGRAGVGHRTELDAGLTLFHDCDISELTVRQVRLTGESELAPYGLRLDVFRFDGTFLSLALDLPTEAITGLARRHIVRLVLTLHLERPAEVFARLNIKHGPNTEAMLREIPDPEGELTVEFDLAYTDLNEKRIESAWLDLIFEGAEMNQIELRDLTLCRYPRAEI